MSQTHYTIVKDLERNIKIDNPSNKLDYFLNNYGGRGACEKIAYGSYEWKYISGNETPAEIHRSNNLKVGKFYTYEYDPKYADVLDFYDKRPVMLCVDHYKTTSGYNDVGINFNFIPYEIKKIIMKEIYDVYGKDIKENKGIIEELLKGFLKVIGVSSDTQKPLSINTKIIKSILGEKGYQFALRSYIPQRRSNIKVIDYDEWFTIPLLRSEDVIGTDVASIHKLYYSKV